MPQLINMKLQAVIGILTLVVSWIVAQAFQIGEGHDQLYSLGLLSAAVIVIWKAFTKKDESETKLLREQIKIQKDHIEQLQKIIDKLEK